MMNDNTRNSEFPPETPLSNGGGHHPNYRGAGISQRGRPRGPPRGRPSGGMKQFMDNFMSPFARCWQPNLNACVGGMEMRMPQNYACGDMACADMPSCGSGSVRPRPTSTTTSSNSARQPTMATPMATSAPTPSSAYEYSDVPQTPHTSRVVTDIEHPTETDVLCGRGGSSNRHNVHFREMIAANKATYATLTKKQKMLMSRQVVDTIHQAGGRFLAKDPITGRWNDIGLSRSLEKASQALREKSTNNPDDVGSVTMMDTEMENVADKAKVNPRTVEAPPLIIPPHLKEVYKSRATPPVTPSPTSTHNTKEDTPGWVAGFPPVPENPSWVAEITPDPSYSDRPPHAYHHPQGTMVSTYHPSDRVRSMPAPHRGAYPFTSRQMSRMSRQSSMHSTHSTTSMPAPAHSGGIGGPPMMISPAPHHLCHHPISWQPSHPAPHYGSVATPMQQSYRESRQPFHAPASPDYASSATSCNTNSTATNTPPELHQYSQEFHQEEQMSTTSTSTTTHPHPKRERSPEMKRQRTQEDDDDDDDNRDDEEEDVILFDDSPNETTFSLHNTSLTEGSQQLPAEVESKLSLQEKVISPSALLQSRSSTRRRGDGSAARKSNTSADEEGLAGLAALSTAAFLRLDEG